jgi:SagB-type dehydrogenase family enzyme
MPSENGDDLFELFWENSKLNRATIQEFGRRINTYAAEAAPEVLMEQAGPDHALLMPKDQLQRVMAARRSGRSWSARPLTMKQLGALMAAFAKSASGMRTFPSAGATYAVEVFCIVMRVEGALCGRVVQYNADNHSVSDIGAAPPAEEIAGLINLEGDGSLPALIFVIALIAGRTTAKYGERGGRFALIEAGQALQNLALRVAAEGLSGVELGGLLDDRMRQLLHRDSRAMIALGFACGHPA